MCKNDSISVSGSFDSKCFWNGYKDAPLYSRFFMSEELYLPVNLKIIKKSLLRQIDLIQKINN